MSHVVLDTDVSSKIIKRRLSGPLTARLTGFAWCVTFVTVGELWQWAETRRWGDDPRAHLEHWLSRVVVIDSDEEIARTWGRIGSEARQRGRPRPANDSWIAACCLSWNLPLATTNIKDFVDYADHDNLLLISD